MAQPSLTTFAQKRSEACGWSDCRTRCRRRRLVFASQADEAKPSKFLRLQKWKRAEPITDTRSGRFPDRWVSAPLRCGPCCCKSEVTDGEMLDGPGIALFSFQLAISTSRISASSEYCGRKLKFHITFAATCGSFGSSSGNGCPATLVLQLALSLRPTCEAYFSVAALYGGGHSRR